MTGDLTPLMNYMTGVPSWSDHFLTLADGRTLTIPEGKDAWEVYEPYLLACLSEGMCPWCASALSEERECFDARHRPCRWHRCPEGFGQVFLDVPRRSRLALCSECGEPM
jgi:hypothetical protein